ncbi:MAG: tetratricopeptide repeat protein [Alcanivoracaceae bacterium]
MTSESERIAALERALQTPPQHHSALLLHDRARLVLAGIEIDRQQYARARAQLVRITTDSPMAARAGLLVAESWRLQGDEETSLQWLLRVGRHFPDDINALQGLLAAAEHFDAASHPGKAIAVYEEVMEKSLQALNSLAALPADRDARIGTVIFRTQPMPAALRHSIASAMIRQSPSLGETRRVHRDAGKEWQCLLLQQQQIDNRHQQLRQHLSQLDQAIREADDTLGLLAAEMTAIEKRIVGNDFSADQIAMRQRLSQGRNDTLRLNAERQYLAQIRDTLPAALATTEARLDAMTALLAEIHDQSATELFSLTDAAINLVMAEFRNLAAESQRQAAEVLIRQSRQ